MLFRVPSIILLENRRFLSMTKITADRYRYPKSDASLGWKKNSTIKILEPNVPRPKNPRVFGRQNL